jgi:hypothetical protein
VRKAEYGAARHDPPPRLLAGRRAEGSARRATPYDTVDWWDDANHFVNWAILVAGFGQILVRTRLDRAPAFGLAVGFGAVTAILWEFLEYYTFIRHSSELQTAYTDTLGDLALGLSGSVLAAVLMVTVLWPRARAEQAQPPVILAE